MQNLGQEQKLYDLIWKRTIASQMADAELEKTTATVSISNSKETFVAVSPVQSNAPKFEEIKTDDDLPF